jgi:hypothetical protein
MLVTTVFSVSTTFSETKKKRKKKKTESNSRELAGERGAERKTRKAKNAPRMKS